MELSATPTELCGAIDPVTFAARFQEPFTIRNAQWVTVCTSCPTSVGIAADQSVSCMSVTVASSNAHGAVDSTPRATVTVAKMHRPASHNKRLDRQVTY